MTMQMSAMSAMQNVRMTRRWLRTQALVMSGLALLLLALAGQVQAYSSMLGGLAAFVPSVVFALIMAPRFGKDSNAFLRAAVLAESAKWLITALICMAVFIWVKPLAAGWFFAGMGAVILAGWAGLIFSK
jgi:ATP synthase protein I